MSGVDKITSRGWEEWPRDVGTGFSFKGGGLLCDMQPTIPADESTGLIVWRGIVWQEGSSKQDPVAVVTGDTHWECAANVQQVVNEWQG